VDLPVGQQPPQPAVVRRVPQRGAHHELPGVPLGRRVGDPALGLRAVLGVVGHQVLRAGLRRIPDAAGAVLPHDVEGARAGHVNHIDGGVRCLGEEAEPVGGLPLGALGPGVLVVPGRRVSGREFFGHPGRDDGAVLAVEADGHPQFAGGAQRLQDLVVGHHHRAVVAHVHLERRDPGGHQGGQLLGELGLPLGERQVESVVGDGPAVGEPMPVGQPLGRRLAVELGGEVDHQRRAPGQRRPGAGHPVVRRHQPGPAVELEMGVAVDPAGQDQAARGVHDLFAGERAEVADRGDGLAVDPHGRRPRPARGHHRAAGDQDGHVVTSLNASVRP